jgi:hypothetical protein
MDTVDEISGLEANEEAAQRTCVFARPGDRRLIETAAAALGLPDYLGLGQPHPHVHPHAHVEGEHIYVLAFTALDVEEPLAVELVAAEAGLLVIAEDRALDVVRRAVERVDGDGRDALTAALVALGRATGEALDELAGDARAIVAPTTGFTSTTERNELTRIRAALFVIQQMSAAQGYLLGPDEDLAHGLPKSALRALRQARAAFAEGEATAARLYALAEDLLNEQSALVNERLTLVATIFLPLSVSTSFFGMNFGWMTGRIGTAWTFFGLGVILPLVVTFGTVIVVGRMTQRGRRHSSAFEMSA